MKIIENNNKNHVWFQEMFYNDVFRSKNSGDIYIRIPHIINAYGDEINAWSLTSGVYAFVDPNEEVELLDAELHINS